MKYLGYHENILIVLVLPRKCFKNTWFALSIKMEHHSVEKNMNIQQALFFFFLKKTKPIKQKSH